MSISRWLDRRPGEGGCGRSSVRRLRRALGLPATRRRRGRQVRTRRTPKAQMGALVQLDASPFAWFEDRGPQLTLHGAIDDATGTGLALHFRPAEDLHGYATGLHTICTSYGLPVALYGDRLNVFVRNDPHWTLEEELRGTRDPTHFGRILQELGIGYIAARSPQAKGRIERFWQTLQDRLVSELRLRGLSTAEAANAFLPAFLTDLNRRFARAPADAEAAWRPTLRDLAARLSCRYTRIVARDNTVRLGARWVQLPRRRALRRPPRRAARVPEWAPARVHRRPVPRHAARARRRLRPPPPPLAQFRPRSAPTRLSEPRGRRGPLSSYPPKTPEFTAAPLGRHAPPARRHTPLAPQHALLTPRPGMTFSRNS
jgi:hypothetical protein